MMSEVQQLRYVRDQLREDARRYRRQAQWYAHGGRAYTIAGFRQCLAQARQLRQRAIDCDREAAACQHEANVERQIVRACRVLGLERYHSADELRAAYHRLAFALHPDHAPVRSRLTATKRLAKVNAAHDFLKEALQPQSIARRQAVVTVRDRRLQLAAGAA